MNLSACDQHDLRPFAHSHSFADEGQQRRQRALAWVAALTLATMALELLAGWWTGSLALTADGWHMGTHALALGGAVLAYRLSLRAASHRAVAGGPAGFAFGGWKIEVLAAYTSGLVLLGVAAWLAWEGISTLREPRPVDYRDALVVAVIGLVVNLASVWMLSRGDKGHRDHDHGHGHSNHHDHHPGHDHNFNAAYLHVLADAFTSLLAIVALVGGAWFGLGWLDPAAALLGAAVIGQWSLGMLRRTALALVDATEEPALTQRIRDLIEADGDALVSDLHVWQVGAKAWSAALAVVADAPHPTAVYRERLQAVAELRQVTVELHRCLGHAPA